MYLTAAKLMRVKMIMPPCCFSCSNGSMLCVMPLIPMPGSSLPTTRKIQKKQLEEELHQLRTSASVAAPSPAAGAAAGVPTVALVGVGVVAAEVVESDIVVAILITFLVASF